MPPRATARAGRVPVLLLPPGLSPPEALRCFLQGLAAAMHDAPAHFRGRRVWHSCGALLGAILAEPAPYITPAFQRDAERRFLRDLLAEAHEEERAKEAAAKARRRADGAAAVPPDSAA